MSSLQRTQICHCGHDRATHFEQRHTCLGMLCECTQYVHEDAPKPVPPKPAAKKADSEPPLDAGWFGGIFGPGPFGP